MRGDSGRAAKRRAAPSACSVALTSMFSCGPATCYADPPRSYQGARASTLGKIKIGTPGRGGKSSRTAARGGDEQGSELDKSRCGRRSPPWAAIVAVPARRGAVPELEIPPCGGRLTDARAMLHIPAHVNVASQDTTAEATAAPENSQVPSTRPERVACVERLVVCLLDRPTDPSTHPA